MERRQLEYFLAVVEHAGFTSAAADLHVSQPSLSYVTHDVAEALKLGDRIQVMRDGEVLQTARGAELVARPADDYVRTFVRNVPRADVLTLRWLTRDPRSGDLLDGPELHPDVVVRDAVHAVFFRHAFPRIGRTP